MNPGFRFQKEPDLLKRQLVLADIVVVLPVGRSHVQRGVGQLQTEKGSGSVELFLSAGQPMGEGQWLVHPLPGIVYFALEVAARCGESASVGKPT